MVFRRRQGRRAILNYFLTSVAGATSAERYSNALLALSCLREHSGNPETGQDIYLAAADHYLETAGFVLEHPNLVVVVAPAESLIVKLYDTLKLLGLVPGVTSGAPSRPTLLSLQWGQQGVIDAIRLIYGDAVHGLPPHLQSRPLLTVP